jgi:hypothetical protein
MFTRTRQGTIIAIVLSVLMALSFAGSASATSSPSVAQLPASIMMAVSNAKVSAADVANKRVVFLENIRAKGLSHETVRRAQAQGGCRWIGAGTDVPGYWNSGHSASGGLFWFWDTRHVQICMVGGQWRKVLCGNYIRFTQPVHHVITTGRVIMVRSFAHMRVRIHLEAIAVAKGSCGEASASARLTQVVKLRMFVKTKGRSTVRLYGKLVDKAGVRAKARVHCDTTVVVISPPTCTSNCHQQELCTDSGASNYGGSLPCVFPPPCTSCQPQTTPPSVTITSYTRLNMVPAGKTSGPAPFTVNASDPGSVTVDPGMGGISDCSGGPEMTTPLTFQIVPGDNDECVIYYAPDDADQPQSDTITYSAIVTTNGGTAKDIKQDTFALTYPIRP